MNNTCVFPDLSSAKVSSECSFPQIARLNGDEIALRL